MATVQSSQSAFLQRSNAANLPRQAKRMAVQMSLQPTGRPNQTKVNAITYPNRMVDLDDDEKQRLVESAAEKIRKQTEERERQLKIASEQRHMEHELKFGKMLQAEGKWDVALLHFEKVLKKAPSESYFQGEATLQKAFCLEKLGREDEARSLYESLVRFRAPYPHIKRRAMQALFGGDAEGSSTSNGSSSPSPFDDYMYRMFLSGFAHYVPKTKYVETEQEKTVMQALPWAILMMAPLLIGWLLVVKH